MPHPDTLSQKVWDRHVVRAARGRARPALHRPPPRPRGHLAPGLRRPAPGRPHGPPARPHRRHRGPQRPHRRDHRPARSPTRSPASRSRCCGPTAAEFGIACYPMGDPGQGIVHVIGPEQGLTQPGMTIVCGDSHTSTHGAFGALAFGIGTSEVEHVLATQTLPQQRARHDGGHRRRRAARRRHRQGRDPRHHRPHRHRRRHRLVIEYRGSAIRALSMEGRMTVCNMSIEAGAKAGLIAPDDTTFAYLEGRADAPTGAAWDAARRRLAHARHRRRRHLRQGGRPRRRRHRARTSPGAPTPARSSPIDGAVPDPTDFADAAEPRRRRAGARVHGPRRPARRCATSPSTPCSSARAPTAASRTCGRAAAVAEGRRVAAGVRTLVVPGSLRGQGPGRGRGPRRGLHRRRLRLARAGLLDVPGHEPRQARPRASAAPRPRNRNFEGRQGRGGRTHLVSPAVAAATAIAGHFATPADL